ncbi:hypothetical protein EJ110_NYTH29739 [Nymphaea thermarum]|nr:hypothetical protein EJ110_NYTH29739 [Nymphaea thermarum]
MSLRYMSRIYANAGARAFQYVKDQGAKIDGGFKNLQPASKREGSARNQMRRFSGAAKRATAEDQKRREAEKAEKVYHLICWGPQ